jgi:hypothetical protein
MKTRVFVGNFTVTGLDADESSESIKLTATQQEPDGPWAFVCGSHLWTHHHMPTSPTAWRTVALQNAAGKFGIGIYDEVRVEGGEWTQFDE